VCHRIRAAFFAGDLKTARMEQARVNAFVSALTDPRFGGNLLVTARHVMEKIKGIKLGPVRTPHVPMTREQEAGLEAALKAIGFSEWCDAAPLPSK
jgi:dihydrodipicolinate synthase/N-acetylneuraminate lyase